MSAPSVAWAQRRDRQGPYWCATICGVFAMVVPVAHSGRTATYSVLLPDLVSETRITKLATAKAHAVALVGCQVNNIARALGALSSPTSGTTVADLLDQYPCREGDAA